MILYIICLTFPRIYHYISSAKAGYSRKDKLGSAFDQRAESTEVFISAHEILLSD